MPSRRTTVIALGTLFAGGGAALGTGAFDTVEAERSVSLETAPDSDALLAFEIIDDEHVSQTGGTIDFDLVARAATTFAELVDVRNQGTQTVTSLQFEFDVTGGDQSRTDVEDALRIVSGDATIDATGGANLLELSDAGAADDDELSPGEAVPFGIEVDLTGDVTEITGDPEITLTIIADTGGEGGGEDDGSDGSPESGPPTFSYADGPDRDPPNTPSRSLTFEIENTGGATTVEGFEIDIDPPGGSSPPEEFEGFEIDPAATGEPTVNESDTEDDLEVGSEVEHASASYRIPSDSTAAYTIETFDRDPSQNGELDLTVLTADGEVSLPPTGFESPGNG